MTHIAPSCNVLRSRRTVKTIIPFLDDWRYEHSAGLLEEKKQHNPDHRIKANLPDGALMQRGLPLPSQEKTFRHGTEQKMLRSIPCESSYSSKHRAENLTFKDPHQCRCYKNRKIKCHSIVQTFSRTWGFLLCSKTACWRAHVQKGWHKIDHTEPIHKTNMESDQRWWAETPEDHCISSQSSPTQSQAPSKQSTYFDCSLQVRQNEVLRIPEQKTVSQRANSKK